MNQLRYKIGLINYVTINSPIGKDEIIKRLKDMIDIPLHIPERKGKRLYIGQIQGDEFWFRRKKGFLGFDEDSETLVKVLGRIKEDRGHTIITTKIMGQMKESLITWTLISMLLVMISILLYTKEVGWNTILLLIGVFIFAIFQRYFKLRKGIAKMSRTVGLELSNLVR